MASLTQVSITARRGIRFGIYLIIFIVSARYAFLTGYNLYRRFFPKPPPAPTVEFGKLPKLVFPDKSVPENLTYKLETPSGELPLFIDQLPVYVMPISSTNIRALEDAKDKAQSLGFAATEADNIIQSIPNVFIFKKSNSSSLLTMNIITGEFAVSYDFTSDVSTLAKKPTSIDTSIQLSKSFFNQGGSLPTDIDTGTVINNLVRVEKGELVPAISLSEANFVKVNFIRKAIAYRESEFAVISKDFPEANVWALTNGAGVIAGEYHYFPIDYEKSATYPVITSQKAWEDLAAGKAYITNLGNNQSGNVTIRRVYLGYYDAGQYVEYFQPVAVFEGDNDFYAVVPAVTEEYYGK